MTFVVRRVLLNEYHKYTAHLKALDPDSRVLRFGFSMKEETLDKLCKNFEDNAKKHILFCVEDDNLDFIAIGHVALGDEMELAFSVLKEYQGQGIGDKLMKRCINFCRLHGYLRGCMVCLSHNKAIKHLCVKNGIRIHSEFGETMGDITLNTANLNTVMLEVENVNRAVIDYGLKRIKLPWTLIENILN
jgi:GNAT superfamily N-acetyltransferase